MVRRSGRRAGYTILELMVVVTILGVIAAVGPLLLTNVERFFDQDSARAELQRDARVALDQMNRTLRQASAATVIVTEGAGQPPYSKISFMLPDGTPVAFELENRRLLRVSGGSTSLLAGNVEYLAFTYPQSDDNTALSITMTLRKRVYGGGSTTLQAAIAKVRVMNP